MKNNLIKLAGIALLVISFGGGWFWLSINNFAASQLNTVEGIDQIIVPQGTGLIRIANDLEEKGLIDSARKMRWVARFRGDARDIKVGEYELAPGLTVNGLLDNMVLGKVKQYSLTIVEGWNFKQLRAAIAEHPKLEQTTQSLTNEELMQRIGFEGEHPEGRFLPDTYLFPIGTTDVAFLKRAHQALQSTLELEWPKRDVGLPYKTPYEALIMASIVEKETAVAEERNMIAGVFVRRLHKRMRLQTDPTVIYGMGDKYKGNIRRRDLKRDTPYNTYTRRGLPPTPIAMAGTHAIRAALHPAEGEELYFVAKGDGSHYFSKTIKEHNRAVKKYQVRNRRSDYRSTPNEE